MGISIQDFYKLDAAELYWAYKSLREDRDNVYHERYEVARFLGILIKKPSLLNRLTEILPFHWEKGKKAVKQSVGDMKRVIMAIAGKQGISKTPLPKQINLRMEAKRKREQRELKRKQNQKP